eukprot:7923403-Pyramimonas_sp.AAC.1
MGLRSAQLSPLLWPPGMPGGGTSYADHHCSSRCPGWLRYAKLSDLRKCRHFRGLLGGPAEVRPTQITTIARGPQRGLRSAKLSTLSWAPGRPSG